MIITNILCTSEYFLITTFKLQLNKTLYSFNSRVASRTGISGNLEKSGNFVALGENRGKVREFNLREMNIAEVFSIFIQVVNKN